MEEMGTNNKGTKWRNKQWIKDKHLTWKKHWSNTSKNYWLHKNQLTAINGTITDNTNIESNYEDSYYCPAYEDVMGKWDKQWTD